MKRTLRLAAFMLALVFVLAACSSGGNATSIKLATGSSTGTYYAYGGIIAQVLNDKLGDTVNITVQSTGASKANIFLIADGEAEMAVVQNDVMDYGYYGTDLFTSEGAIEGFSAMAALYPEVCQIVAAPVLTSVEDLRGLRVSVGDSGSGVEFNARQILEAYGMTFDDIVVSNLGFTESAEAYKDSKIDAFFCVAGAPTTAIVELATSNDISLIAIDDTHAVTLMQKYPFYTQLAIPGGSYNGVAGDVMTVAIKATFIVSDKLSEDVVYAMTKALFDYKTDIAALHDKGSMIDPEYAVSGISIPFHSGAEKYFKEIGVL